MKQVLLPSPFYRWIDCSTKRLRNLPKDTQITSNKARIWTLSAQVYLFIALPPAKKIWTLHLYILTYIFYREGETRILKTFQLMLGWVLPTSTFGSFLLQGWQTNPWATHNGYILSSVNQHSQSGSGQGLQTHQSFCLFRDSASLLCSPPSRFFKFNSQSLSYFPYYQVLE